MVDELGKMIGVMKTEEALQLAKERGLDLIEISPKAQPPVVKILSYDKFRYQQEKVLRQQKKNQRKIDVKGVRISVRIGVGDMAFKAGQADKFLSQGHKVKIEMFLRGREKANIGFAFEVLKKFLTVISAPFTVEQEPKRLGGIINVIIAPK